MNALRNASELSSRAGTAGYMASVRLPSASKRGRTRGGPLLPNFNVLDLAHDAIYARSLSGVIECWNRGAEKLYGWTAAEAVGRVGDALFKTIYPAPLDQIEAELLRTGYWEGELVQSLKDGARVTVASRWSLLRGEALEPIAVLETNNDITERKRGEAERAELEQRLRQAEKLQLIGRFASGIAHDFNNVLGGILGYSEMLFDEAPEDTPRRRYAQNVMTAATRGRDLAEQILAYARDQRGTRSPTDVCAAVAETLDLMRSSLPGRITLHAAIPDTELVVMGDATQLYQVVMNLCGNSIHAMKAGGPLRVAITPVKVRANRALSHGTVRPGQYVCLSVEDGGCGMDEATLERIFEPFFTTKEAGRGTGLGLALVYAIVADLGGVIDVKSVPDEGTTFSIYIPMAVASPRVAIGLTLSAGPASL
ncbi:MAG TPA: ATP-binding protein [Gammaproteobacteria bacterium]|nr:ATP-binding protein [Gammaproteobacteria bacterium]